jgi:hypothetical protein
MKIPQGFTEHERLNESGSSDPITIHRMHTWKTVLGLLMPIADANWDIPIAFVGAL